MWPKPKVKIYTSVSWVSTHADAYRVSGTPYPGATRQETVVHELIKPWLYVSVYRSNEKSLCLSVSGRAFIAPHVIHINSRWSFWPLFVIQVAYGWTVFWWKPWKWLLTVRRGGPFVPQK